MNPINETKGTEWLRKPIGILAVLLFTVVAGFIIAKKGLVMGGMIGVLPFVVIYVGMVFRNPRIGIWTMFCLQFFILGVTRYISGIPLGLSVDGLLVLTYIGLIFKNFDQKVDWSPAANLLTYLALFWFGMAILQLVNPETQSRVAWFYAMRGIALYMILTVPLVFILLRKPEDIERFLLLWACFSILGTLKGIGQKFFGVDPFEQRWLDEGGDVTHILFGKLRIFSFYSDAGQFGAAQAMAGVVFTILFLNLKDKKDKFRRYLFGIAGLLGFYGMLISGTRGAIAVPVAGIFLYLILTKNVKILSVGIVFGALVFIFLKFTTIGNNNYDINRMRTALDPNDASLQTRKTNQLILKGYLKSRPFGGGIGSSGAWGKRFAPNSFLANVATDSWYVVIWAEQGIIGLMIHLGILFTVVGRSGYIIMFKLKHPRIRAQMMAFNSGLFGMMGASYGNAVLGQMPSGIIIYFSMAFMFMSPHFDAIMLEREQKLLQKESKQLDN